MLHEKIARDIPQLARGQVWCRQCGSTQRTESAKAMRYGWPKCCGYTMTIDSPEEQKRLAAAVPNEKVSDCPTDFIPAGAKIIIGVDMADDDCTVKGFYDPKTGEYHIQEVVHNK